MTHSNQLALIRYLNEELLAYDSDRYEDEQECLRTPIMRAETINPTNPYAPLNFHSPIPTLPDC